MPENAFIWSRDKSITNSLKMKRWIHFSEKSVFRTLNPLIIKILRSLSSAFYDMLCRLHRHFKIMAIIWNSYCSIFSAKTGTSKVSYLFKIQVKNLLFLLFFKSDLMLVNFQCEITIIPLCCTGLHERRYRYNSRNILLC